MTDKPNERSSLARGTEVPQQHMSEAREKQLKSWLGRPEFYCYPNCVVEELFDEIDLLRKEKADMEYAWDISSKELEKRCNTLSREKAYLEDRSKRAAGTANEIIQAQLSRIAELEARIVVKDGEIFDARKKLEAHHKNYKAVFQDQEARIAELEAEVKRKDELIANAEVNRRALCRDSVGKVWGYQMCKDGYGEETPPCDEYELCMKEKDAPKPDKKPKKTARKSTSAGLGLKRKSSKGA